MNTFYLVRHGEKVKHAGDPELTEIGKQQAIATGKFFKNKDIIRIVASSYNRTVETAGIINKFLNVQIKIDDKLRERMNWGNIPNEPFEEFLKEWEYSNTHRDYKPNAGISSLRAGKNAIDVINDLNTKLKNKNVLIVTHGGLICDFLRSTFDEKELSKHNPEFMQKLDQLIHECSITTITIEKNKFKLKEIGATGHLVR